MKKEIDWMGLWYEIIKERGENDKPSFGCLNLNDNTIDWMDFSHKDMDGVGALFSYYEKLGIKLKSYPMLKEKKAPNFFLKIKIIFFSFFHSKKIRTEWKEQNFNLRPSDPKKIEYYIFTEEETSRIERYCKEKRISTNALFMNISAHHLLQELSLNKEGTWTLPVNLRPILANQNFYSNHSSAILVSIHQNDSLEKTHQKIIYKLKNKEYWAIWWSHQIGRIVGYKGMRYISNQNAKKTFLIGSFSNLSSWDLPPDHIWIGGAPGSKNFPITMMSMAANKRISLCLKIHPFILKKQNLTEKYLHDVVSKILNTVHL